MQARSHEFDAAIAAPLPDRREMVAEHLERLAALVRTYGVVDGELNTGPFISGEEQRQMEYKVRLVIDRPDRPRPRPDMPVWEFDGE
jgi:hypothetical protein